MCSALEIGGPELRPADCLIMLSEARRSLSEFALALDALKEAQVSGLRRSAQEVVRLEGELLLICSGSQRGSAEACFHKALPMARDQQARILELRAATSLARLWRNQGERQNARDLLVPVYAWFTEGLDTQDLKGRQGALLEELQFDGAVSVPKRKSKLDVRHVPTKSLVFLATPKWVPNEPSQQPQRKVPFREGF